MDLSIELEEKNTSHNFLSSFIYYLCKDTWKTKYSKR